jgi:hypothetical protein
MRSTLVLGVIDLPENGEPQRQQARAGLATQGERATGDELVCGVRCGDGPLLASCRPSIVKRHHWSGREEVVDARLLTCTLILKCIVILKNLQDPVFVLANLAVEAEVCASSFSLRHTFVRSNSDMVVFPTHNGMRKRATTASTDTAFLDWLVRAATTAGPSSAMKISAIALSSGVGLLRDVIAGGSRAAAGARFARRKSVKCPLFLGKL